MSNTKLGQIIVPTGGGKTICMIKDAQDQFNGCSWDVVLKDPDRKTIVVVAPRILLAQQLCEDFEKHLGLHPMLQHKVLHVHSGETHHFSTTHSATISQWADDMYRYNKLIFTTYHSLHRIQESGISVDTIYFDEAHNSVQRHFFTATKHFATRDNGRCFFFTATPKHSSTDERAGMNDRQVFGNVLCEVSAPELVESGHILPPKVVIKKINTPDDSRFKHEHDCDHLVSTMDDIDANKILICARSTKQIVNLVSQSDFCIELRDRGYNWMYITAKTGAVINGKKVNREEFFTTLNQWGEDDTRFVVLHHSILSEGINVKGLEAALFLRNMDYITIQQTIGRVIRKGNLSKTYGLICVPVYDKVGISTAKSVNAVVDTVFNKGEAAVSIVK